MKVSMKRRYHKWDWPLGRKLLVVWRWVFDPESEVGCEWWASLATTVALGFIVTMVAGLVSTVGVGLIAGIVN